MNKKVGELENINNKPNIAFVCVHNSCRSQIAEALAKKFAIHVFNSYSAGTELKDKINSNAVRLVKEIYDLDMEESQKPKLIDELPQIDIVITMGCDVYCPYLYCKYKEDWNLADPTGKSGREFKSIIYEIEKNILKLSDDILNNKIKLD